MKLYGTLLLCFVVNFLQAQDSSGKKLQFFSTNQVVHLEGSKGSAFAVQTVNGLQIRGWGAGVGVGLDQYGVRSLPVFVHLRRQFPFTKIPLYLYADLGRNFGWPQKNENPWVIPREPINGKYWDGGLQYHLVLKGRRALVFSAGYSEKTYAEEQESLAWCNSGNCPVQKNIWRYRYRRIALKAGFQF